MPEITARNYTQGMEGWVGNMRLAAQLAQKNQENEQQDALRKYLQGAKEGSLGTDGKYTPGTDAAAKQYEEDQAVQRVQGLLSAGGPGHKQSVHSGSASINFSDAIPNLRAYLTPAQEAAEKEAGKKISDFEGGGKQGQEANIGQIQDVQNQLKAGKKDNYDRFVGGALESHPTLMGILAPSEKARRDQVQNAQLGMLHEAGIPRPTQWDIQRVFGQTYDSAADDASNAQRLTNSTNKMTAQKQAAQAQANQYHKTGYATIGSQAPASAPQGSGGVAPAPQAPQTKQGKDGLTYAKNPATGLWEAQ